MPTVDFFLDPGLPHGDIVALGAAPDAQGVPLPPILCRPLWARFLARWCYFAPRGAEAEFVRFRCTARRGLVAITSLCVCLLFGVSVVQWALAENHAGSMVAVFSAVSVSALLCGAFDVAAIIIDRCHNGRDSSGTAVHFVGEAAAAALCIVCAAPSAVFKEERRACEEGFESAGPLTAYQYCQVAMPFLPTAIVFTAIYVLRLRLLIVVPVAATILAVSIFGRVDQTLPVAAVGIGFTVTIGVAHIAHAVALEAEERRHFLSVVRWRSAEAKMRRGLAEVRDVVAATLPPRGVARLQHATTTYELGLTDGSPTGAVGVAGVVDFAHWSTSLLPVQVVLVLHRLNMLFDSAAGHHDVDKAYTYADRFVVVAGLPLPGQRRLPSARAARAAVCKFAEWQVTRAVPEAAPLPDPQPVLHAAVAAGPVVAGVGGRGAALRYHVVGGAVDAATALLPTVPGGHVRFTWEHGPATTASDAGDMTPHLVSRHASGLRLPCAQSPHGSTMASNAGSPASPDDGAFPSAPPLNPSDAGSGRIPMDASTHPLGISAMLESEEDDFDDISAAKGERRGSTTHGEDIAATIHAAVTGNTAGDEAFLAALRQRYETRRLGTHFVAADAEAEFSAFARDEYASGRRTAAVPPLLLFIAMLAAEVIGAAWPITVHHSGHDSAADGPWAGRSWREAVAMVALAAAVAMSVVRLLATFRAVSEFHLGDGAFRLGAVSGIAAGVAGLAALAVTRNPLLIGHVEYYIIAYAVVGLGPRAWRELAWHLFAVVVCPVVVAVVRLGIGVSVGAIILAVATAGVKLSTRVLWERGARETFTAVALAAAVTQRVEQRARTQRSVVAAALPRHAVPRYTSLRMCLPTRRPHEVYGGSGSFSPVAGASHTAEMADVADTLCDNAVPRFLQSWPSMVFLHLRFFPGAKDKDTAASMPPPEIPVVPVVPVSPQSNPRQDSSFEDRSPITTPATIAHDALQKARDRFASEAAAAAVVTDLVAQFGGPHGILQAVEAVGDTFLAAGPFDGSDGEDPAAQADAARRCLALLPALQQRLPGRPFAAVLCTGSAYSALLGLDLLTYRLFGPGVREAHTLLAAAPDPLQSQSVAFATAAFVRAVDPFPTAASPTSGGTPHRVPRDLAARLQSAGMSTALYASLKPAAASECQSPTQSRPAQPTLEGCVRPAQRWRVRGAGMLQVHPLVLSALHEGLPGVLSGPVVDAEPLSYQHQIQ